MLILNIIDYYFQPKRHKCKKLLEGFSNLNVRSLDIEQYFVFVKKATE
jgi:hypothetical protein